MSLAWAFLSLCVGFVLGVVVTSLCQAAKRAEEAHEREVWERVGRKK